MSEEKRGRVSALNIPRDLILPVSLVARSKLGVQRSTPIGREPDKRAEVIGQASGPGMRPEQYRVGVVIVCLPCRSKHVHAFQPLRTVHLCEHLIYHPIRDTGAVVSSRKDR